MTDLDLTPGPLAAAPARQSVQQTLRQDPSFSWTAVAVASAASLVGTTVTGLAGAGDSGRLLAALLAPVVPAVFSMQGSSSPRRTRLLAMVLLTLAALVVSLTGWAAAGATKDALSPDSTPQRTRLATSPSPARRALPDARALAPSALACPPTAPGAVHDCEVQVHDVLDRRVRVTGLALADPTGAFSLATPGACVGVLERGDSCSIGVRFAPRAVATLHATLVIHQDLPGGPTTVRLTGAGDASCDDGLTARGAYPGDTVCVSAQSAAEAEQADLHAQDSWVVGPYGPHTCVQGLVWREARDGDDVCVTPDVRARTAQEDQEAAQHYRYR